MAPDVKYLLARAETLQLQSGAPYLTAEHLASAMDIPMGGQGGGKDGGLSKAELEDTMRQMLGPVSTNKAAEHTIRFTCNRIHQHAYG